MPDSPSPLAVDGPTIGWRRASAVVALSLGACTGVVLLLDAYIDATDSAMIYLVGVMVTAYLTSAAASVLSALLAVVAFDFFATAPRFTLDVDDAHFLVTFAVMAGAGLSIASLTHRLRRKSAQHLADAVAIETEQMRNAMLASVSHDLRTPLATIMGTATALAEHGVDPASPHGRTLLATLRDESERLEHQLGNLLQMTRIQGGALRLNLEWHVPEELVGQALHRLRSRLGQRPVTLAIDPDPELVRVDALAVELVLANLLENAVKYSPENSEIEIRSTRTGPAGEPSHANARWQLMVLDRGAGLPPGDPETLFQRFTRGATDRPGVGLGLAICAAMVRAHDGRISAADRADGGACFTVELPAGAAPAPDAEAETHPEPVR